VRLWCSEGLTRQEGLLILLVAVLSLRTRERVQVLEAWAGRGPEMRLEKTLKGKKPRRGSAARSGQPGLGRNGLAGGSKLRSR